MPQFYVYVYRDPSRGDDPIYVGKGFGNRARSHLKRKDKHPFTQRLQAMKANGVEPHIEIINAIDEDQAYFMEECCIQVLGRKDLCTGTLLNLCDGGKGGTSNPSAETRKKNSDAHKGKSPSLEHRKKLSEAQTGKLHTPQTRQKISNARKGKPSAMKGKVQPMLTCPHCDKVGRTNGMKQWHFDKCKYKKE